MCLDIACSGYIEAFKGSDVSSRVNVQFNPTDLRQLCGQVRIRPNLRRDDRCCVQLVLVYSVFDSRKRVHLFPFTGCVISEQ